MDADIDAGALRVVETLRRADFQAVLAGGCVRDLALGRVPKDWDVATDAGPAEVAALFEHTVPVGAQFGISVVMLDEGDYEVARFRSDGPYRNGRHPASIEPADARADAARRDFTINGLFYDPERGELLDYVGGQQDLDAKIIRAIGDPAARFAEDHLRLLRAVRFAARLGFTIEPETWDALCAQVESIASVSAERIRDELTLLLTEGEAVCGLRLLDQSGLLQAVLPEVAAMRGVPQDAEFHPEGDVWTHVQLLFEHLDEPSAELAWGALLHDIGKPSTMVRAERIRFHGHDAVGAKMAAAICGRLRMSNEARRVIGTLVADHMRISHVLQMRPSTLVRLLREPHFPELLELHRADCLASHGKLDLYEFCQAQLAALKKEHLRPTALLTGDDLIALGFAPGPLFREILAAVEDAQLEGQLDNYQAALRFVQRKFCAVPAA
ncbi:MAG: CCA tRNA nucleotidyltransferase [Gemmatimonadetes bacterium]|nr:CCA tRNA nucleotidyltransferase [Gemmatimonadota bacterium]MXY83970.1 CCA tRNA nucleotidyltransferase [Gemmatimonadota bacterium]MYB71344.1 CCA tRNA nucleotidyltransferase [Gemmatimonadota bacterium]